MKQGLYFSLNFTQLIWLVLFSNLHPLVIDFVSWAVCIDGLASEVDKL